MLQKPPILKVADSNYHFTFQTDAPDGGIGAVLSQTDQKGLEHPVAYASRRTLIFLFLWAAAQSLEAGREGVGKLLHHMHGVYPGTSPQMNNFKKKYVLWSITP